MACPLDNTQEALHKGDIKSKWRMDWSSDVNIMCIMQLLNMKDVFAPGKAAAKCPARRTFEAALSEF